MYSGLEQGMAHDAGGILLSVLWIALVVWSWIGFSLIFRSRRLLREQSKFVRETAAECRIAMRKAAVVEQILVYPKTGWLDRQAIDPEIARGIEMLMGGWRAETIRRDGYAISIEETRNVFSSKSTDATAWCVARRFPDGRTEYLWALSDDDAADWGPFGTTFRDGYDAYGFLLRHLCAAGHPAPAGD